MRNAGQHFLRLRYSCGYAFQNTSKPIHGDVTGYEDNETRWTTRICARNGIEHGIPGTGKSICAASVPYDPTTLWSSDDEPDRATSHGIPPNYYGNAGTSGRWHVSDAARIHDDGTREYAWFTAAIFI